MDARGTPMPPEDGVTLTGPWEYGPGDNTWLRPLVVRYLKEMWGVPDLVPDSVGEYRYRVGGAECRVSVHDRMQPATVEVFATAATDVALSAALLPAINELNAGDEIATVYWSGEPVMVKHSILGATIHPDHLRYVCAAVGETADRVGALMASAYGGSTPFPNRGEPRAAEQGTGAAGPHGASSVARAAVVAHEASKSGIVYAAPKRPIYDMTDDEILAMAGKMFDAISERRDTSTDIAEE
jgi:hypothetical protein